MDGAADFKEETSKKRPCQKRRTNFYKSGAAPGQGRCGDAGGEEAELLRCIFKIKITNHENWY